jgi:maleamate amidohydrolase
MTEAQNEHAHSSAELEVLQTYRVTRPETWVLANPALLVVDVVDSFVGLDAPVAEAQRECPTACGAPAWTAVRRIAPLLAAFRDRDLPVAFSTVDLSLSARGAEDSAKADPDALRPDVVVSALSPRPSEFVFSKIRPSAFFGTPLITWLHSRAVDQLVVVGGATSGCVLASVLDAYSFGYDVLLPADACFDRVQTSHLVSLTDIDVKYARVIRSVEVLNKLDGMR